MLNFVENVYENCARQQYCLYGVLNITALRWGVTVGASLAVIAACPKLHGINTVTAHRENLEKSSSWQMVGDNDKSPGKLEEFCVSPCVVSLESQSPRGAEGLAD